MLEVAKERTTQSSMSACTLDMFREGACPYGVEFGESYVRRALNEPCDKQVILNINLVLLFLSKNLLNSST